MNKLFVAFIIIFLWGSQTDFAQTTSTATLTRIVRLEDERRFDRDLQDLLRSPDAAVRTRAALAAGRIGDESAITFLADLLAKDANQQTRAMIVFALGEIESAKAADVILKVLQNGRENADVRARAVEAAGKIAAANAKDEKSKGLGKAILDALEAEHLKTARHRETVLLGLTAALRAKPAEADTVVAKFLTDRDARIRTDAANSIARLRTQNKEIAAQLRAMLLSDSEPTARANAARALGAAEDKAALDLLIAAATTDADERVRVSAIRALAALKDKKAAAPLLTRGEELLAIYEKAKSKKANLAEKNELLEIATTLGRLLQNSNEEKAVNFLKTLRFLEKQQTPEIELAFARISPSIYTNNRGLFFNGERVFFNMDWRELSSIAQGWGEFANFEATDENKKLSSTMQHEAFTALNFIFTEPKSLESNPKLLLALPDLLRAYAAFKAEGSNGFIVGSLKYKDVFMRATAAELLGEQPASKEKVEALKKAFDAALASDKNENDAQLAILSALVKLDKNEAIGSLKTALDAPDYLVRRHAVQLVKQNDLTKEFPDADAKVGTVKPHNPASGSRLGQIFYTDADYARAVGRKNGQSRAVLTTEKGVFTIEFFPEDAPLAVDNFIRLAKSGYFDGLTVHRVVPNFVMQDGDPRGDGNGGPGWQIRCEINQIPYERGAVGMALSGKDTGGSQWFVTHSPQPHLDGGYTVFGRVNESDMKIVDKIARGDKILTVKIIEGNVSRKGAKTQRKTK
jgi:cyclophilin family peptidyl-prolyl cis-trans isomerase/HEAT repeat protein